MKRILPMIFFSSLFGCSQKQREKLLIGTWDSDPNIESPSSSRVIIFFFDDSTGVYETLKRAKVESLTEFRYTITNNGQFIETTEEGDSLKKTKILELSNKYLKLEEFYNHRYLVLEKTP